MHAVGTDDEPIRLDPTDGCMALPQKPGLGVELDEDKIRRYAQAG